MKKTPVTVPESKATLTVSVDSVLRLPAGAVFTEKNGQARVKIERSTDHTSGSEVIVVEATCDSLQLQCEEYYKQIMQLKQHISRQQDKQTTQQHNNQTIKQSSNTNKMIAGTMAIAIAAIIVYVLRKHNV